MKNYFFISYAADEDRRWVQLFHAHLEYELQVQVGSSVGGTLDTRPRPGRDADLALADGAGSTRSMVALCSDPYFKDGWCGREWEIFSSRVENFSRAGATRLEDGFLRIRWRPMQDPVPAVAANELAAATTGFPENYAQRGLLWLMRNTLLGAGGYYAFVRMFAARIVAAQQVVLDPLPAAAVRRAGAFGSHRELGSGSNGHHPKQPGAGEVRPGQPDRPGQPGRTPRSGGANGRAGGDDRRRSNDHTGLDERTISGDRTGVDDRPGTPGQASPPGGGADVPAGAAATRTGSPGRGSANGQRVGPAPGPHQPATSAQVAICYVGADQEWADWLEQVLRRRSHEVAQVRWAQSRGERLAAAVDRVIASRPDVAVVLLSRHYRPPRPEDPGTTEIEAWERLGPDGPLGDRVIRAVIDHEPLPEPLRGLPMLDLSRLEPAAVSELLAAVRGRARS